MPQRLVELAMRTAGTAPLCAYRQPWRFVVIDDPVMKAERGAAAVAEEKAT